MIWDKTFILHGDPAYPVFQVMQGFFDRGLLNLTQAETNSNEKVSAFRILVE